VTIPLLPPREPGEGIGLGWEKGEKPERNPQTAAT